MENKTIVLILVLSVMMIFFNCYVVGGFIHENIHIIEFGGEYNEVCYWGNGMQSDAHGWIDSSNSQKLLIKDFPNETYFIEIIYDIISTALIIFIMVNIPKWILKWEKNDI